MGDRGGSVQGLRRPLRDRHQRRPSPPFVLTVHPVASLDRDITGHPPDEALLADLVRLVDQVLDAQLNQVRLWKAKLSYPG